MKKDNKTSVGGRRNSVGNDYTAGNSVGNGMDRSFSSSKTTSVAKQNKRFEKTRTRRGEKDAV